MLGYLRLLLLLLLWY